VALFTGCIASAVDRETLESAIRLLTWLGIEVRVPAGQACCGALHLHAGDAAGAARLAARNLEAFDIADVDAVISVASGCGATLGEYFQQSTDPRAAAFSARVRDLSQFLVDTPWPEALRPAPLNGTVAVHDPCSLANVMHAQAAPYRLLERIPGLRVAGLAENPICCGGAGAYLLDHPRMADDLRRAKLAHIRALAPDAVITSNLGCALHLAAGLRDDGGPPLEVLHPATLLARQIAAAGFKPSG
jgi:glycolate oxidase iron-sulfur subunit